MHSVLDQRHEVKPSLLPKPGCRSSFEQEIICKSFYCSLLSSSYFPKRAFSRSLSQSPLPKCKAESVYTLGPAHKVVWLQLSTQSKGVARTHACGALNPLNGGIREVWIHQSRRVLLVENVRKPGLLEGSTVTRLRQKRALLSFQCCHQGDHPETTGFFL